MLHINQIKKAKMLLSSCKAMTDKELYVQAVEVADIVVGVFQEHPEWLPRICLNMQHMRHPYLSKKLQEAGFEVYMALL